MIPFEYFALMLQSDLVSYNLTMGNNTSTAVIPESEKDQYDIALDRASYKPLLQNPQSLSARQKKWRRFRNTMHNALNNAKAGAMMGGMVGGMFGLIVGVYSAVQTRRLLSIPISVIISGGTFGFIMGCGSLIRNDDKVPANYNVDGWKIAYSYNRRRWATDQ